MNLSKYLGDSYDIVKLSFLKWLRHFGEWSVHPMLTEEADVEIILAYERLLKARVISTELLTAKTDRELYFKCTEGAGNLFLDPDTGIRLEKIGGKKATRYLFADELVSLVQARHEVLTLVFDQSLPHGGEKEVLVQKLKHLLNRGVYCFAYQSHACFLLIGCDSKLVENALHYVIEESGLPTNRFLRGNP